MGIFDRILGIFGKKAQSEAIQSDVKALSERSKAMQERSVIQEQPESQAITPTIELEKDSLQLGMAAGYTGRSLKAIESSLVRIESQMTTKDWFDIQFGQSLKELVKVLKQHEDKEQLRFEAIQDSLNSLRALAKLTPQPIRTKLYEQIQDLESQLPITQRMREIVEITSQAGEISYEDLAKKLNLGTSGLRGLLSVMVKRTNEIKRFEKDGKGWLRFTGSTDLNRSQSAEKAGEASLRDMFEIIVEKQGFNIVKRFAQSSPDFIIQKDNKTIGVEIKLVSDTSSLEKGMGQLLLAKISYNLQDMWLVLPSQTQPLSEDCIQAFKSTGIKVFILSQNSLEEIL